MILKLLTSSSALALLANSALVQHNRKDAATMLKTNNNRVRRANSGVFEEFQASNMERECVEERCDIQELTEIMENDNASKDEITEKFNSLGSMCATRAKCNPKGSAACYQTWGGFECICKREFNKPSEEINVQYIMAIKNDQKSGGKLKYGLYGGDKCDQPVNECDLGISDCDAGKGQICVDQEPSTENPKGYTCECEAGKVQNADGVCVAATCDEFPCDAPFTCAVDADTQIPYCACPLGHQEIQVDGVATCEDVDECENPNHCAEDEICTFTAGVSECKCREGYDKKANGDMAGVCSDIDECDDNPCHANAQCSNTEGSYECNCAYGYASLSEGSRSDADQVVCANINECEDDTLNTCLNIANSKCVDTEGDHECQCSQGYEADRSSGSLVCNDVDECASFVAPNEFTVCANEDGSHVISCTGGNFNLVDNVCVDVDECADETNPCGENSTCVNNQGGFECACNEGYTAGEEANTCVDIDECETSVCIQELGNNAVCVNTPGSYQCSCAEGFVVNEDGICDVEEYDDEYNYGDIEQEDDDDDHSGNIQVHAQKERKSDDYTCETGDYELEDYSTKEVGEGDAVGFPDTVESTDNYGDYIEDYNYNE